MSCSLLHARSAACGLLQRCCCACYQGFCAGAALSEPVAIRPAAGSSHRLLPYSKTHVVWVFYPCLTLPPPTVARALNATALKQKPPPATVNSSHDLNVASTIVQCRRSPAVVNAVRVCCKRHENDVIDCMNVKARYPRASKSPTRGRSCLSAVPPKPGAIAAPAEEMSLPMLGRRQFWVIVDQCA